MTAAESEAGTASAPGRIRPASRLEHEAARARTEQLFREHGRMVRGLCSGLLRDRAEADDAAQQTFLAAHRALLRGGDPREPAAWLAAIARNECLARVRERMREPLPTMELRTAVSTSDPVTIAIARGDLRAMWRAVSELSPQQQRAFLLREFGGLSYEELAVALGVSTGAIESLLFRARLRLRSRLEAVLASLGMPAWLAAVRDLVPRWLDAGGATKVAAATAATVVAGGTFVGERELVHPRHAAPVASSALRSTRPVERAAVIPTPEAAPTARSPERRRADTGRRAALRAVRTDDDAEATEVDGRRGGGSGERNGSGRSGPAPAPTSNGGDRAAMPEDPRIESSGPASVPSSSSGERGPGGGSEGPGSSDSSGKGSSGEGSGEPEGLTSTGETSGSGSGDSGSGGSSGSDKGSSGSGGVDSDGSGSGKGGSGPDSAADD